MKKLVLLSFFLIGSVVIIKAAATNTLGSREFESYVDTGQEMSAEVTLNSAAGQISTVTVPSWAKGVRFYPRTDHVRFSIQIGASSRIAEAVGTASAGAVVSTSTVKIGGIAKGNLWETRLLPFDDRARYIYLRSTTGSVVVDLEFF